MIAVSAPQDWTALAADLSGDTVRKLCQLDMKTFLLSGTIPKMERQCMRFSLENRLPLLDNEGSGFEHGDVDVVDASGQANQAVP